MFKAILLSLVVTMSAFAAPKALFLDMTLTLNEIKSNPQLVVEMGKQAKIENKNEKGDGYELLITPSDKDGSIFFQIEVFELSKKSRKKVASPQALTKINQPVKVETSNKKTKLAIEIMASEHKI